MIKRNEIADPWDSQALEGLALDCRAATVLIHALFTLDQKDESEAHDGDRDPADVAALAAETAAIRQALMAAMPAPDWAASKRAQRANHARAWWRENIGARRRIFPWPAWRD